jgi:hypothetical protein
MKLVWTYDSEVKTIVSSVGNWDMGYVENRKMILLNYYIHSIKSAKELGYYTIIYCNSNSVKYFKDLVDEFIVVDKYENTPLWDGIKTCPLEHRNDSFCLIDGDIILHKRLPEFDTDIVFDVLESGNWEKDYEETVNKLDKLNIGEIIPEWCPNRILIANSGVLYVNNKEFKNRYINGWKEINNFIKNHLDEINTFQGSLIAGQLFFTLLMNKMNISNKPLSEFLGHDNGYYTHFYGGTKFKNPITKYNSYILEKEGKKQNLM